MHGGHVDKQVQRRLRTVYGDKHPQKIEKERPARPQEAWREARERRTAKASSQTQDQRGDRDDNGLRNE